MKLVTIKFDEKIVRIVDMDLSTRRKLLALVDQLEEKKLSEIIRQV
jgi:hypothetical protein